METRQGFRARKPKANICFVVALDANELKNLSIMGINSRDSISKHAYEYVWSKSFDNQSVNHSCSLQ